MPFADILVEYLFIYVGLTIGNLIWYLGSRLYRKKVRPYGARASAICHLLGAADLRACAGNWQDHSCFVALNDTIFYGISSFG